MVQSKLHFAHRAGQQAAQRTEYKNIPSWNRFSYRALKTGLSAVTNSVEGLSSRTVLDFRRLSELCKFRNSSARSPLVRIAWRSAKSEVERTLPIHQFSITNSISFNFVEMNPASSAILGHELNEFQFSKNVPIITNSMSWNSRSRTQWVRNFLKVSMYRVGPRNMKELKSRALSVIVEFSTSSWNVVCSLVACSI